MKIILVEDLQGLGKKGDVVEVKSGYARNKLIPNKLALIYTDSNSRKYEESKRMEAVKKNKAQREALHIKEGLESLSLTIPVQAGEDGKLFGAVTNIDIEEALKKEEYEVDKRNILLDEPIKEIGVYTVGVQLHSEVKATLKLWVVSK